MRRAALVLAVVLAGCGGGDRTGGKPGAPVTRAAGSPARAGDATTLRGLLARRAAALQGGHARAYAATSTGAQRARDRRSARNARRLRLRDVELAVRSLDLRGRRATLRVTSLYGVRGVAGRFAATRRVTAVRTRAGWRVRAETSRRERHPWEVGPVTERRTRHFVVLAPRGIDLAAGGLLEALEAGYRRMRQTFRRPRLQPRYLVVVAGGPSIARALTQQIRGVGGLAAISDTEVREEGAARRVASVASQRLFVVWTAFRALDPAGRLRVVTHELTHAALAKVTSGRTPAWLLEGAALYVSGDRRVDSAARLIGETVISGSGSRATRRSLALSPLSRPDAIARLGGAGQEAAYAYSSAAAFYIVARFGRRRYLDLYDAFNDETLEGRPGVALTDRAVRRVLGISFLALERDLRRWILTRAVVAPAAP